MKICFILEYYHPHIGGVEYLFKTLTEGLRKRGYEVTVLTRRLKGTKGREFVDGVRVIRIRTLNRYVFTFFSIPWAIFLARGCDIIHTTTFNGAFPAWVASKVWGITAVITILEVWLKKWRMLTDMNWLSALVHNLLERMIYLLSFDFYVAISHSTERQLSKVGVQKERMKVIYNGFEHDFFNPERYDGDIVRERYGLKDAFICFSWGRPGVSKGHEYLIMAVPRIVEKIPHAVLLLMLSDKETYRRRYRYLIDLIRKLEVSSKVILVEPVPRGELGFYLKAADCIVIPSIAEGFGYAALEACSIGTPVVASDTTSIPEVIGGRYVLVEPKNPEAIAKGVESVYKGEYRTSELKVFPWDRAVAEYMGVYDALSSQA